VSIHHKLIGFYNQDEKCLQRGTDWIFKYSSLHFVFKGLGELFRTFRYMCTIIREDTVPVCGGAQWLQFTLTTDSKGCPCHQ